jgi:oligopeptidase B
LRGGGEMGKAWHDAGRMQNKQNTFQDFIASADHLVSTGRAASDSLTIEGRSAGGLLIGACVNLRPDLFRAAIAGVPFVDVLTTMLDPTLPLTVGEYEEWGDPNRPEDYFRIKSYSPYDNLGARAYPAMLVKVAIHDSQVPYWEGAKFVAKMRTLATGRRPILLHANLDAGHAGASGRYDRLGEAAFDAAFLLWQVDRWR